MRYRVSAKIFSVNYGFQKQFHLKQVWTWGFHFSLWSKTVFKHRSRMDMVSQGLRIGTLPPPTPYILALKKIFQFYFEVSFSLGLCVCYSEKSPCVLKTFFSAPRILFLRCA